MQTPVTADYPHKAVKIFDGSLVYKYTKRKACSCKGVWGHAPGEILELGSLRVHLLAIHISVSHAQINQVYS